MRMLLGFELSSTLESDMNILHFQRSKHRKVAQLHLNCNAGYPCTLTDTGYRKPWIPLLRKSVSEPNKLCSFTEIINFIF